MARNTISKKDGTPTQYFWSDRDGTDIESKRVYKKTEEGIKRMSGVRFNTRTNRIRKV